ncbi:50S ribosomal protein L24e [Halosimplex pelagicum]|uniref:Large ribosomal subunit protein eL24 n=1 Tax=Halosimplex pelagicum TaxID=869886 RepID=A0A7D5P9Q7_9EURY|nr:50S ribosomal protein L24e [Halosimplex pelagicum]QLH84226.1 50S ribosomal protein L24e [Halosimplex pelagicum]
MPRTRECDYCGTDIEPGTGTMFVRTNGSTIHYCSSKCEKNANLGRESRDLEWAGEEEPAEDEDEEESEPAADERPTDIEDQGQDVDAPGDTDEDLDDVEPDEAVEAGASDPDEAEADEADADDGSDDEESDAEEAEAER